MIDIQKTLDENAENKYLEGVFVMYSFFVWNSKKSMVTCLHEKKNFFHSII